MIEFCYKLCNKQKKGKIKMKKGLFKLRFGFKKTAYVIIAFSATFMMSVPALTQDVSAAQVVARSIEMSSSAASATSVSYNVTFTPQTNIASGGGIVVDICSDSPIIGSTTCLFPTGFDWGGATPTLAVNSGMGSTWTAAGLQGGAGAGKSQTLELTSTGGTLTNGTPANFTISSVTNPSATNTSFYARILTFDTAAHMTSNYTVGTSTTRVAAPAGMQDYGGAALSTANTISITATVMETLTFCTSKVAPGTGCSGLTSPNLTLGTGTPPALSSASVSTDTAYTQISSNDQSGTIVRMTDNNTCTNGGLKSGANCIPGNGSFATIPTSTADFGLNVGAGSGGTGTVTANANYGSTAGSYGMGSAVTSTYGDPIEASTAATANVNSLLTFGAQSAPTTPAGIYTATMTLIATGTF